MYWRPIKYGNHDDFELPLSLLYSMCISALRPWFWRETNSIRKTLNVLPRHWRSIKWGKNGNYLIFPHRFHAQQTLTKLDLRWNRIWAGGAHCLSDALKINQVNRDDVVSNTYRLIGLFSRHSRHSNWARVISVMKAFNTLRRRWKSIG